MEVETSFSRILVPIDGSDHADRALDFALDIAEKYGAEVEILTVLSNSPTAPLAWIGDSDVWVASYSNDLRLSSEKMLSDALDKARKNKPHLHLSKKLLEGRPSDEIVRTAQEGNFDLIVMGSRGLGGITEFFLGSVSNRVADEADCPVIIVK